MRYCPGGLPVPLLGPPGPSLSPPTPPQLVTLRGSILEDATPTATKPGSVRGLPPRDALEYVVPELNIHCLRLALSTPKVPEQLLKLDEQGVRPPTPWGATSNLRELPLASQGLWLTLKLDELGRGHQVPWRVTRSPGVGPIGHLGDLVVP